MGIFSNKREREFEGLHNDNLFDNDDDILIPAKQRKTASHNVGAGNIHAPHAITADELSGAKTPETVPMEHSGSNSVYERMKKREEKTKVTAVEDDYVPSWATSAEPKHEAVEIMSQSKTEKFETAVTETSRTETVSAEPTYTNETKKTESAESAHSAFSEAFLERCRVAVEKASAEDDTDTYAHSAPASAHKSLITDTEPEKPTAAKPETRSVDEIINMLRGKADAEIPDRNAAPNIVTDTKTDSTAAVSDRKVNVEVIPMNSDSDIMHTTVIPNVDKDVRVYGKIVKGTVIQQTPDGDFEGTGFAKPRATEDTVIVDDKTIMFGDLGDMISKRADDDFNSQRLQYEDNVDDEGDDEYDYSDEKPYYETEDEGLRNTDDYKDLNDAARLLTKYAAEKSKNKILSVFSLIASAVMILFATPISNSLSDVAKGVVELIVLAAVLLVNFDIFADFKNLFKRPKLDSAVAVSSIVIAIQTAVSTFMYDGKYNGFAIAAVLLLTANRAAHLMKSSRVLRGLRLIANSDFKRAVVSTEGDNASTISSGAVDSEAIVLCDREAVNIKNYIKNSNYAAPFDLKIKTLLIIALMLSAVAGIVAGIFVGLGLGLTVASAILCCLFPAVTAFICELPMFLSSSKAGKYGAIIAGYKGAYELNKANLAAVNSSDLFPEGSVTLYNMKTLSENEIGRTLLDAGAVAEAANSPLFSIFKNIIGNEYNKTRPKVNGVKYEDKMGISGWIGERTILIGNRNLMQGHNIAVPPASVDQKILHAGYFPVYIAVNEVPCLLFIVKYDADPEITNELQELCSTGMTIVVNPQDPNTSSAMIRDYFGLPDDALKVMNHNGRVAYEHTAARTESCSAPAVFKNDVCGFFSAISASIRLNGIFSLLTALFIIAAVLGVVLMVFLAVTGKLSLFSTLTVAGFQLFFLSIAAIVSKIKIH